MMMSNDTYTHPPTETRMLLKSGADSNLEMEDGRTPIHIAAEVMINIMTIIDDFDGVDDGRTPIHIAAEVLIMTIIDNIDGGHLVALWCFFFCCDVV